MKILHRYILQQQLRNLALCLMVVVFLFLIFDFFDRIDNIVAENASLLLTLQYFLYKIPLTVSLMLPVAIMAATLLTIGVLSKNSEITAMRAAGVAVRWIAAPLFGLGIVMSLLAMLMNETLVPYAQRRVKEIYNIDIRQKHASGVYSQHDIWWRIRNVFFSAAVFDSRTNTLHAFSKFEVNPDFEVRKRVDAESAAWLDPVLGWNMRSVTEYRFDEAASLSVQHFRRLPLPIGEKPSDFYDAKTDPYTMTYQQLAKFIKRQAQTGLRVAGLRAYLFEKMAFPFINFMVVLVVLPFALKPARSGSMTASVLSAMLLGFSYYAIHSFSLAMGRAEFLAPFLAAWMANLLMGFVGLVLMLGAEAP